MVWQRDFPSFGYWMGLGATTCWEDWSGQADASHPPLPTHGHIFLCAGALYTQYRYTLGLAPLKPGFSEFGVSPSVLPDAGPATASLVFASRMGNITVNWARTNVTGGVGMLARARARRGERQRALRCLVALQASRWG